MRILKKAIQLLIGLFILSTCDAILDHGRDVNTDVNFQYRSSFKVGGEAAAEISAYDPTTKKLFVVNVESVQISVFSLADLDNPAELTPINISPYGVPNSVAVKDGQLAVAAEAKVAQDAGSVLVYNTADQMLMKEFTVGALPEMVTFTGGGMTILSANEGEPSNDYSVDPNGSVSIIDLKMDEVVTLDFSAFNGQEAALEA